MKNLIGALALLLAFCSTTAPVARGATSVTATSLSGTYTGAVKLPNGTSLTGTGQITIAANRTFTIKITAFGKTFQTSGTLNALGQFTGNTITTVKIGGFSFNVTGLKITLQTVTNTTGTWLKGTGSLGSQSVSFELHKTA